MNFFDYMAKENIKKDSPLAMRLRPEKIEDIKGQEHILGKDKLLYRAIKADRLRSLILYGPPGTGKTTIAKVIAETTQSDFKQINATTSGKKDMEEVVRIAKENLSMYGKKTILFVDEIHRFNKAQQDYLLPFVEEGIIVLIGATTENPYFEVNQALLSRAHIFELHLLSPEHIRQIVVRAINDKEKGMGSYNATIDEETLTFLSHMSGGDARFAINAIELAILTSAADADGQIHLNMDIMEDCIQKKSIKFDKDGDYHYDIISAFIKSMRGSNPDATVYYLARLLEAGEDIKFIARRIMICASEDVGNADPMALVLATNASMAVERIGMPEARILLSQAAIYVATAPKSNASYLAINTALDLIKDRANDEVPIHLRDGSYKGAKKMGRGIGYKYAHDYPHHYVKQQYLPDGLVDERFYYPSEEGYEMEIQKRMKEREE